LKKKIVSLMVAVILSAFTFTCVPANAASEQPAAISGTQTTVWTSNMQSTAKNQLSPFPPTLGGPVTRSTTPPSGYWNLGGGYYSADLQLVGPAWLYTNYYFSPNANGIINVYYSYRSRTGAPTKLRIGAYDMSQRRIVATWTSEHLSKDTSSMHFYNLSKTTKYAIAFTCVSDSTTRTDQLSGDATIQW